LVGYYVVLCIFGSFTSPGVYRHGSGVCIAGLFWNTNPKFQKNKKTGSIGQAALSLPNGPPILYILVEHWLLVMREGCLIPNLSHKI
jgi:hypothetical protein